MNYMKSRFTYPNSKQLFILLISLLFLIRDTNWFMYTAIVLCVIVLAQNHRIDIDLGDLLMFYSSYRFVLSSVGNAPWAFCRGLGLVAIYQLGKNATNSDKHISPAFVIAPAIALLLRGLLDYSQLTRDGFGELELWPEWGGEIINKSEHEYYLVLIASILVYFMYYTVKISKTGIIGILVSLGAVVLAMCAKGRLAFWSCVISAILVGIGIMIEKELYRIKAFRIATASTLGLAAVIITLFATNTFGLHDSYNDSMWSQEGGPIYNSRFDMMGQQINVFVEYWFDKTGTKDNDPALINGDGEEVYSISNSWLQTGRKKGVVTMLWAIAFSIYSIIRLVTAWKNSLDPNKYVVISAFIGITFLNTIEAVIFNNVAFWALEVYLTGMLCALYKRGALPKKWDADILLSYV